MVIVDLRKHTLKTDGMNKAVGKRVKRLRQEREWTQRMLADRAKVTPNTIRGLERGTLNTRWPKLERIARALGTTPEGLLQDPSAILPSDPRLERLTDEDFAVARLFHDAPTAVRQRALALLRRGEADLATRLGERLSALPADSLAHLEGFIALEEEKPARGTILHKKTK